MGSFSNRLMPLTLEYLALISSIVLRQRNFNEGSFRGLAEPSPLLSISSYKLIQAHKLGSNSRRRRSHLQQTARIQAGRILDMWQKHCSEKK